MSTNRQVCTKQNPMPKESTERWVHEDCREVGEQQDGYPGGDMITIECLNCGKRWKEELPQ